MEDSKSDIQIVIFIDFQINFSHCNVTGTCMSPDKWQCGVPCGPGYVQCLTRSADGPVSCIDPGQCLRPVMSSSEFSSVLMLPSSVTSFSDQSVEMTMKTLWDRLPNNVQDSDVSFQIIFINVDYQQWFNISFMSAEGLSMHSCLVIKLTKTYLTLNCI